MNLSLILSVPSSSCHPSLQILINPSNKAYGVLYQRHGIPQIAHAKKEVIISCGAIQSPLLLIKSGLGPKEVLEDAKIPVKVDLSGVGKNFRDHTTVALKFRVNNPNTTIFPILDDDQVEQELINFHNFPIRSGHFTKEGKGPQAFIVSSRAKYNGELNWPDIQIVFSQGRAIQRGEVQTIRLFPVLTRPKSVGEIWFNSTAFKNGERNDTKLAMIDHRSLTEKSDSNVLLEGIKLAMQIVQNTTTFQEMETVYDDTGPEECSHLVFQSDEYWQCFIKERSWSYQHYTGTCKMSRDDDPMGVVGSNLR